MHKHKSYCRFQAVTACTKENSRKSPRVLCAVTLWLKDVIGSSEIGAFHVLPQRYTTLAKSRLITHVTRGQVSLVKLPYSNFYSSQALLRPGSKNMFRNMDDRQFLSPGFLELDKILNMKKLQEEIGCSSTLIIWLLVTKYWFRLREPTPAPTNPCYYLLHCYIRKRFERKK